MERMFVGKVTEKEKDRIENFFNRKNALLELIPVFKTGEKMTDPVLYKRALKDLADVNTNMAAWWQVMEQKYHWQSVDDGRWKINFGTCEIELIESGEKDGD